MPFFSKALISEARNLKPWFVVAHRVELCRGESGQVLRAFGFDECDIGGQAVQEFRGVRRGHLLQTLSDALPPGSIIFNANVASISQRAKEGAAAGSAFAAMPDAGVLVKLEGGGVGSSGGAALLQGSFLVGADGTRSVVAQHLGLPLPNYAVRKGSGQ